ncbi:ABC transporter substrate-binding protein [Chromobacterium sp. ATCC 53434]|uniref:heme/hemin ABC transporter substrate-binding protein n=1 Tax=Chromobacterium sp. (strain ATCC 53434 / SC 14030) TaxID=2059672 RepID=UPI000C77F68A|nr:ABC transporter substrate-binding protein [Chromobacterium sp. ATCC 53434]AUH49666.1 ABC transporter substrate-binding protein [Chromobacterium sp. ATCC 53434]
MSRKSLLVGLLLAALPLAASAAERLVVVTPDIAEIVVALGAAGEVVGRDRSSREPELAHAQVVGFSRALNAEAIAKLKPTLVLGSAAAQPPTLWPQLKQLRLRAEEVSAREDGRDFAEAIRKIGGLLGRDAAAAKLAGDWQRGMQPRPTRAVRYLVSYDGSLVAGRDTAPDTLIRAAGGVNAAAGLSGFKPLGRDAWQALKPDVIILGSHTSAVYGGKEAFTRRPEIAATPAGKQGRVYQLPPQQGMLIGLGSPAVVEQMVKM